MSIFDSGKEFSQNTCCLCLSDDESTFDTVSFIKSTALHEMVNYCIGTPVRTNLPKKLFVALTDFHS